MFLRGIKPKWFGQWHTEAHVAFDCDEVPNFPLISASRQSRVFMPHPLRGLRHRRFSMSNCKALATVLVVFAIVFATVSCGSMSSSSNRVLQSMSVSPTAADAQNSANGQVQFTATGIFSKPPSPGLVTFISPYSGSWSADPSIATLVGTANGTATFQCVAGASGTTTVKAIASTNAAQGTGATSTAVSGTATLTCP